MSKSISEKMYQRALAQPAIYHFNLEEVPARKYMERLETLFHDPAFKGVVEKRNRLVFAIDRLPRNSQERLALIKQIQKNDDNLAHSIFAQIVQANVHSNVTYDNILFSELLKYYVDYTRGGMSERVTRLASNLDKLTFLSDMIESIITDIKGDMDFVFEGHVEFRQFDGVQQVLRQLNGFFSTSRDKSEGAAADLYQEYADSINKYLDKRLTTYTAKYRRLHPTPSVYTEQDMVNALNQFFGTGDFFTSQFIKRTDSGGIYIDAVAVAFNLNDEQTKKLDGATMMPMPANTKDGALRYCFAVTDAIMQHYKN